MVTLRSEKPVVHDPRVVTDHIYIMSHNSSKITVMKWNELTVWLEALGELY